ncbi:PA2779 family protein [Motiliproteus sp. SC1-56]|uniref:PA2779 family protein n=1 Tax=Motiliproteus sp. SC1-56 TaxID=2799565 RepID=UPI001A8CB29C|nr:PA2779 family protein [Motiliproteus sp. SC1-56]
MKALIRVLIFAFVFTPLSLTHAAPVSSQALLGEIAPPQLSELQSALQDQQIRDQLIERGVDPAQLEQRLATLTPQELQTLNAQIDELPSGGLLGALVLIFIVLIITDAIGATDVFNFVDPV